MRSGFAHARAVRVCTWHPGGFCLEKGWSYFAVNFFGFAAYLSTGCTSGESAREVKGVEGRWRRVRQRSTHVPDMILAEKFTTEGRGGCERGTIQRPCRQADESGRKTWLAISCSPTLKCRRSQKLTCFSDVMVGHPLVPSLSGSASLPLSFSISLATQPGLAGLVVLPGVRRKACIYM